MFRRSRRIVPGLILLLAAVAPSTRGDGPPNLSVAIPPTPGLEGWPVVGRVRTRPASEIASSTWSIGGETLDRDFARYDAYKAYLGPLGAKRIRFQAGWAKTEKAPSQYDWAWLDHCVDEARSQSVQPWLEFSYGNPLYPGGGQTGLGGGMPSSPEALAAWDAWVRATVRHFRDRVHEWAVWNEPDLHGQNPPEQTAELHVRTARIVREEQPGAKLIALSIASSSSKPYLEGFFARVKALDGLDLIDTVGFHGYPKNPDDTKPIGIVRGVVEQYRPGLPLFQNENGAPSTSSTFGALSGLPWTEQTQARWDLRRMMAHHAQGIPFNLFTLMDLHYRNPDGSVRVNTKGLLRSNPDGSVAGVKQAYAAAQHVFAIFDDSLRPEPSKAAKVDDAMVTAALFVHADGQRRALVLWRHDAFPADDTPATPASLKLDGVTLSDPVLVDLRTGLIHEAPRAARDGGRWTVPVPDSPVVLIERGLVPVQ
jgi:hypothetical protein